MMMKQRGPISGYELYEPVNITCGFIFLFTAVVYVLAFFGIEYTPLTTFIGYFALGVVVAIISPRLKIWVKIQDSSEQPKAIGHARSDDREA
ncbi:hypothetical protein [Vibrio marisflavi]|uniref:Uncharacterized protein n=1 Tax=Vibrio marisflavi CECT 7928 TaxID=634439 RepID=A0ABM8ZYA5_9VIBR|nr:hypothetical protein [Vibrio marisflavi]CAH0535869.1 hypothetical protein VMF7928_00026 [Vibrio marisflavi CECT 7928]